MLLSICIFSVPEKNVRSRILHSDIIADFNIRSPVQQAAVRTVKVVVAPRMWCIHAFRIQTHVTAWRRIGVYIEVLYEWTDLMCEPDNVLYVYCTCIFVCIPYVYAIVKCTYHCHCAEPNMYPVPYPISIETILHSSSHPKYHTDQQIVHSAGPLISVALKYQPFISNSPSGIDSNNII